MSRGRATKALTVGTLACVLALIAARSHAWKIPGGWRMASATVLKAQAASPENAIYSMLDAARAGDTRAFLESYTGPIQDRLRQAAAEATEPAFAKYLKESNAAIKGLAISPPERASEGRVKVQVEYVYADRNEVQFVYLIKEGRRWKISAVDSAQRVKTLVPYGSPVTE